MTNRDHLQEYLNYREEIRVLTKAAKQQKRDNDQMMRDLEDAIDYREKKKERILVAITKLDKSLHRLVLVERYINGESAEKISQEIHYSLSRTYDIIREREELLDL